MSSPTRIAVHALAVVLLAVSPAIAGPILDPVGDPTPGGTTPGLDIINSPGFVTGPGGFTLTVNFLGSISAPSAFAPDSVAGFIDLDLDGNPATGATPWTSFFVPSPLDLGSEAYINLFDEIGTPGSVGLYDANTNVLLATLSISFGPNSFSLFLPYSAVGTQGLSYSLVSVPLAGGGYDRAPNGAQAFATPEPMSMAVFGALAVGAFGLGIRRLRLTKGGSAK